MVTQILFQTTMPIIGALAAMVCALCYFQRIQLERPAIGVFNTRDVVILFGFIILLPFLYLAVPQTVLSCLLIATFSGSIYMGLRPLLLPRFIWLLIIVMMVATIVIVKGFLRTSIGWQVYWALNDIVILLVAISAANLYVQGGMRLSHIAGLQLFLIFYDFIFIVIFPVTPQLFDRFTGTLFTPAVIFSVGPYNSDIGLGDLLMYCLFTLAAYKGFGRQGLITAFIVIPIFGAIVPVLSPLALTFFVHGKGASAIPAQTFFGPAALVAYFLLSHHRNEHRIGDFYRLQETAGRVFIRTRRPARPGLQRNENGQT